MASGCILGECKYCGELVWEDENYYFDTGMNIAHKACKGKYTYTQMLEKEVHQLREELKLNNANFTENDLKELHDGTGEAIVCPACGSVNCDYIDGNYL